MQHESNVVCLDPSCFTSLNNLGDTLDVLQEFSEIRDSLTVCVPTEIEYTIRLPREEKFAKLPSVLKDWLGKDNENVTNLKEFQKDKYVKIMQTILGDFRVVSTGSLVVNIRKIGEDSIFYDDVISKLGAAVGMTVFQMLATSYIYEGTIIAFSNKTSTFVKNAGISIREGYSEFKRRIKKKRGIKGILLLMRLVMNPTVLTAILTSFGMQEYVINTNDLTNGLLVIADG